MLYRSCNFVCNRRVLNSRAASSVHTCQPVPKDLPHSNPLRTLLMANQHESIPFWVVKSLETETRKRRRGGK
jgi:hypothetical protein